MAGTVADIMARDVVTVDPEATVGEVIRILDEAGISGVPVVDEEGVIEGVISATDVLRVAAHALEVPLGSSLEVDPPDGGQFPDDDVPGYFVADPEGDARLSRASRVAGGALDDFSVRDAMTSAAFTVEPGTSVPDLADFLLRGRIHRALVVEGRRLRGIVTSFDVLRFVRDVQEPAAPEEAPRAEPDD